MNRRAFVRAATGLGSVGAVSSAAGASDVSAGLTDVSTSAKIGLRRDKSARRPYLAQADASERRPYQAQPHAEASVRQGWIDRLTRIGSPVLSALAEGRLRASMPVETVAGAQGRAEVTHLEAFGRTLAGVAPWLALPADGDEAGSTRAQWLALVRDGLHEATRANGPDRLNFTNGSQPLVDAAFLAQGLLRAPRIWSSLDAERQGRLVDAMRSTRAITPGFNNWLLFAATVEAWLKQAGLPWDRMRVDYALRQHEQWYLGDGVYGDGPQFHFDYYNAYVIQPMLVDVLAACADDRPAWTEMREPILTRARRYAAIQERLIAPDGSFPPVGRSLAYRCGAFHALALAALRRDLPESVRPAQVRGALGAVIARTIDAPDTFDTNGWLRLGLCGHQPGLAERYISTGSLYLCSTAFLPLGLPASDPFWADAPEPWTSVRAWRGNAIPIDHAIEE